MSYYPQQNYQPYPPQGPPPPQNCYQPHPPPGPPPAQNCYQPRPPPGPPPPQNLYQPQPPQGPPPAQNLYQPQPPQGQPPAQNYQPQPPQGQPPAQNYQSQPPQGSQQTQQAPMTQNIGPVVDANSKTMVQPFFIPYVKSEKSPGSTMDSYDKKSYVNIDGYPVSGGIAPALIGSFNMPSSNGPVYSVPLPTLGFNPAADAETLKKAMAGVGTNDKVVISIIGNRTRAERLAIAAKFKEITGKDLVKELSKETSGNYCALINALFKPLDILLAELAHNAVAGLGTNDSQLIDVVTQFTGPEMKMLKDTYQRMYKKQLSDDVSGDTSGSYRKVLLKCINGTRAQRGVLESQTTAQQVAHRLYKAGEGRLGTDDTTFIEIFTTYSAEFLQVVSTEYMKTRGKYIVDAIKSETSFNYCEALISMASTRGQHFARRVKAATKGLGTRDTLLINIFAILEKPDLKAAALAFEPMFGETMPKNVASDTSGCYRDLLLELMR